MAPSPTVKRAARTLITYVKREIARGMIGGDDAFYATRPAGLHDELQHFLAVHDDAKKPRRRGR